MRILIASNTRNLVYLGYHLGVEGHDVTYVTIDATVNYILQQAPRLSLISDNIPLLDTLRKKGADVLGDSLLPESLKHASISQGILRLAGYDVAPYASNPQMARYVLFNGTDFVARSRLDVDHARNSLISTVSDDNRFTAPLVPLLRGRYRGVIKLGFDDEGRVIHLSAPPLTAPIWMMYLELAGRNGGNFLHSLADGSLKEFPSYSQCVSLVSIYIAPIPKDGVIAKVDAIEAGALPHLWITQPYSTLDNIVRLTGTCDGGLGWVSAQGRTPREAQRRTERTLSRMKRAIPNLRN